MSVLKPVVHPSEPALQEAALPGIRQEAADNALARFWDDEPRFRWTLLTALVLLPLAAFAAVGFAESSFRYGGSDNGILQDPIFLTYFPLVVLLVLAIRRVVDSIPRTLGSLAGFVRLQEDGEDGQEPASGATPRMRREELQALMDLYSACYNRLTLRSRGRPVPDGYRDLMAVPRMCAAIAFFLGLAFLALSTVSHLDPLAAYGFDIWSSGARPMGFWTRFVYEAFLYLLLVPLVAHRLATSMRLLQHSMSTLHRRNAFRFSRFTCDGAGGLGRFGEQSFHNVLVVLPFLMPLVAYVVDYPVTPGLVLGGVAFVVVLPLVFFFPLLPARRVLLDARTAELDALARQSNRRYVEMREGIGSASDEELERRRRRIEVAQEIFEDVRSQPVWPFDRRLLARFGSLVVFASASLFSAFVDLLGG